MEITDSLRNRLVGAGIVTVLAMIFIPMLLNEPKDEGQEISELTIPQKPQNSPSLTATILPAKTSDVVEEVALKPVIPIPPQVPPATQAVVELKPPPIKAKAAEVFLPIEPAGIEAQPIVVKKAVHKPKPAPVNTKKPPQLNDRARSTKTGGRWFIQVGSYSKKHNADTLMSKLKRQGFSARVDSLY